MATYNMRLCEAHYSCADVTGAAVSGLECHGSICNRALIRAEASVACSATGTSTRVVAPATRAENRVQKEILRMRRKAKQGPRKIFAYERQREIRAQKKKSLRRIRRHNNDAACGGGTLRRQEDRVTVLHQAARRPRRMLRQTAQQQINALICTQHHSYLQRPQYISTINHHCSNIPEP